MRQREEGDDLKNTKKNPVPSVIVCLFFENQTLYVLCLAAVSDCVATTSSELRRSRMRVRQAQ